MILIGIDIGKASHTFSIVSKDSGEVLLQPTEIYNDRYGFDFLYDHFKHYSKNEVLIGMEDTGHYHFNLLKDLLDQHYTVALINPVVTDLTRKMQGDVSKNDKLDSLTICDVISSSSRKILTVSLQLIGLTFMSKGSLLAIIIISRKNSTSIPIAFKGALMSSFRNITICSSHSSHLTRCF